MNAARLAFESVACLRGHRLLFERLDFALGPGDAALVTGPNGVGKSSLLRLAAGLLRPAAGCIVVEGDVALANDATALDPERQLDEALTFWARIDGRGRQDIARGLEAMGIAPLAEAPVRMLSSGQRKRAALARVIAGGARIWLLDEPGNGLDVAALDRLADAMAAHRAHGGIVVTATHHPLALPDALPIPLGTAA